MAAGYESPHPMDGAFVCEATGEVAEHFDHGSVTKVSTRKDLVSVTYTDALSQASGKVEHWKFKRVDELNPAQREAYMKLRVHKEIEMIKVE